VGGRGLEGGEKDTTMEGEAFVRLCLCLSFTLRHCVSCVCVCVLPGRDLEPGLEVRPRALITSTSS